MENKQILLNYLISITRRIKVVTFLFFFISILSFIYAFFIIEKQYRSQITFLPPIDSNVMSNFLPLFKMGMVSGTTIDPQQIVDIYESKELRKQVIEKYNLIKRFKLEKNPDKFEKAIDRLTKEMMIEKNEIGAFGGLSKIVSFTISVMYPSRDTCFEMAQYSYSLLDQKIREISIESAKREKLYIEKQLIKREKKLDSLQKNFTEFQIKNKAFNISEQIQMAIRNYGLIKGEIISNNIKIGSLESDFNKNFYEVERYRELNRVLNRQLVDFEKKTKPDIFPGLEIAPELFITYTEFLTDIETHKQLIVFLGQQLEQSMLNEERNVSSLHIIDSPYKPEYKFKPKRIFIMAKIILPSLFFILLIIILQEYYLLNIKNSDSYTRFLHVFRSTVTKKR